MNKIFFILIAFVSLLFSSCEKDNIWGEGLAEYEHVYYVGFQKSIKFDYFVTCEIAANGSTRWREGSSTTNGTWIALNENNVVSVPFQFHSERVRSYDAVSKFWVVASGLTANDYSLSLEDGSLLSLDGSGVCTLTWKQAVKGLQKVRVTRKTAATGTLKFYCLDPSKPVNNNDVSTLVNNKTAEYEVDGLSHDVSFDATKEFVVTNSKMQVVFN
ncbi:MAG: hypothetical protein LBD53_02390 [Tannerella sp.]|jgi:hypothetical protein|nr:hypothetical protein [Tannerella sp.]